MQLPGSHLEGFVFLLERVDGFLDHLHTKAPLRSRINRASFVSNELQEQTFIQSSRSSSQLKHRKTTQERFSIVVCIQQSKRTTIPLKELHLQPFMPKILIKMILHCKKTEL